MAEFIVSGRPLELGDVDELQAAQILAAGKLIGHAAEDGTLEDVFAVAEDSTVEWMELEIEQGGTFVAANWVRYVVGDTEVGVIFDQGTTTAIGEVGDGDVSGCETGETVTPALTCGFDVPTDLPGTSEHLAEFIVSGRPLKMGEGDELQDSQILAAAKLLGHVGPGGTLHDAFAIAEDGTFEWMELEIDDGETFTVANWIRYFVGDTEVGVIFDEASTTPIGKVGDGDISGCEAEHPSEPSPSGCDFDVPTDLPGTSEHLAEFIVSGRPLKMGEGDELQDSQILAAAKLLGHVGPGGTLDDAFATAEDGTFEWMELEIDDEETFIVANWIRYFVGDTEVGVIFDEGTTTPIGKVGDGDVAGCAVQR